MLIEEGTFREALRNLTRGILVIIVLSILKNFAEILPGSDVVWGKMIVSDYIVLAISIVILGMLLKIYKPIKTVITFYLNAMVKVGNVPGREQYVDNLIAVAENFTLLIYLVVIYQNFQPVLLKLNFFFIGFKGFKSLINIGSLLIGVYILAALWKNFQPLIEIFTGRITDEVVGASSHLAYVNCPSCGAKNDKNAEFCVSCGKKITLKQVTNEANKVRCQKCGIDNPTSANFCHKCGSKLQ